MKRLIPWILLLALPAGAHPIEPLVTGSPMTVPEGFFIADVGYSLEHSAAANLHSIPVSVGAGIGAHGELSIGGSVNPMDGEVSAVSAGGKVLVMMEGEVGFDVALGAFISSVPGIRGTLWVGRSIIPGLYLQGAASYERASPPEPVVAMPTLRLHHDASAVAVDASVVRASAALQWAPRPRWVPTLEVQFQDTFASGTDEKQLWIVPELITLIEINHVSAKLAVPIGIVGEMQVGVLAAVSLER